MNIRSVLIFKMTFLSVLFIFSGCHKKSSNTTVTLTGTWTARSNFDGPVRNGAVGFTINGTGYLGTGFGGASNKTAFKDFWSYDPNLNFWTQKADFIGNPRYYAAGFGIDKYSKGYLGIGFDGDSLYHDFYEYDPSGNSWTKKTDFPKTGRYGAVGYSVSDSGYIATGFDGNCQKDVYGYDPVSDSWTQAVSIGGGKRQFASAFIINSKAYIAGGYNSGSNSYPSDVWEYNSSVGNWTQKASLPSPRQGAAAFTINSLGYLSTGYSGGYLTSTYSYDPSADTWTQVQDIGTGREYAVGLTINNRGYVVTGAYGTNKYLDDMSEFTP